MASTTTDKSTGYTFTLGQLVTWFFGPGLTVLGFLIWGAVKFDRLETQAANQATEATKQAATLGKIQETLTLVRIQLASTIRKPEPQPEDAQ